MKATCERHDWHFRASWTGVTHGRRQLFRRESVSATALSYPLLLSFDDTCNLGPTKRLGAIRFIPFMIIVAREKKILASHTLKAFSLAQLPHAIVWTFVSPCGAALPREFSTRVFQSAGGKSPRHGRLIWARIISSDLASEISPGWL